MRFSLILDDVFLEHATPVGHPERSQRISAIAARLRAWSGFGRLHLLRPLEVDERWLRKVHSEEHCLRIQATAGRPYTQLDPDTHASADSFRVARLAAGSAVALTRTVLDGESDSGFALVRPPGHHAESSRAMGFCLFNNVAVAAAWALERPEVQRVAIVDFDVHHGNGTQEIFYARDDVLYVSSHQHPLYPGTGRWEERGSAAGLGSTLNLPLRAGKGNGFVLALYEHFVLPHLESFQPDLILVSAGFDAHFRDPLAGLNLDEEGFAALADLLNRAAEHLCSGRIVYLLEGGYDLDALAESVLRTIQVSVGEAEPQARAEDSTDFQEYRLQAEAVFQRPD